MPRPEEELVGRVRALLADHGSAVVMERVARGAGATRWWSCGSPEAFAAIYELLRAGSRVVVYVGEDLHVGDLDDEEEGRIWSFAAAHGEVVFGVEKPGSSEFDVSLLDRDELASAFASVAPGVRVLWGAQPSTADGPDSVTFTPPDADGQVRPRPV